MFERESEKRKNSLLQLTWSKIQLDRPYIFLNKEKWKIKLLYNDPSKCLATRPKNGIKYQIIIINHTLAETSPNHVKENFSFFFIFCMYYIHTMVFQNGRKRLCDLLSSLYLKLKLSSWHKKKAKYFISIHCLCLDKRIWA